MYTCGPGTHAVPTIKSISSADQVANMWNEENNPTRVNFNECSIFRGDANHFTNKCRLRTETLPEHHADSSTQHYYYFYEMEELNRAYKSLKDCVPDACGEGTRLDTNDGLCKSITKNYLASCGLGTKLQNGVCVSNAECNEPNENTEGKCVSENPKKCNIDSLGLNLKLNQDGVCVLDDTRYCNDYTDAQGNVTPLYSCPIGLPRHKIYQCQTDPCS